MPMHCQNVAFSCRRSLAAFEFAMKYIISAGKDLRMLRVFTLKKAGYGKLLLSECSIEVP